MRAEDGRGNRPGNLPCVFFGRREGVDVEKLLRTVFDLLSSFEGGGESGTGDKGAKGKPLIIKRKIQSPGVGCPHVTSPPSTSPPSSPLPARDLGRARRPAVFPRLYPEPEVLPSTAPAGEATMTGSKKKREARCRAASAYTACLIGLCMSSWAQYLFWLLLRSS